jgi:hypothetical protein
VNLRKDHYLVDPTIVEGQRARVSARAGVTKGRETWSCSLQRRTSGGLFRKIRATSEVLV